MGTLGALASRRPFLSFSLGFAVVGPAAEALAAGRRELTSPSLPLVGTQDEVYVVIQGRGVFFHDGKRESFEAGDLLFVAAGTEHRFEDFTDDLAVWVVFYGPQDGE